MLVPCIDHIILLRESLECLEMLPSGWVRESLVMVTENIPTSVCGHEEVHISLPIKATAECYQYCPATRHW